MTTRLHTLWISAVAALAAPAHALAQQGDDCSLGRYLDRVTYPGRTLESLCDDLVNLSGGLPDGPSLAPVFADFNGDHRTDAFLLADGQPYLSVSPSAVHLNYPIDLPAPSMAVTAIAALTPDDGGLPIMLASTDVGLQLWELDEGGGLPVATSVAVSEWSHASRLLAADLDGDGAQEIVGFFALGPITTEVRVARLQRTGQLQPIAAKTFAIPMPDPETLDWDGASNGDELALVFQQRMYVLSDQLNFVHFELLAAPAVGAAAVLDDVGPGLAVLTRSGTTDYLQLFRPGGAEVPVTLGTIGVSHVIAADSVVFDPGDLVLRCAVGIRALANRSRIAPQAYDGVLEEPFAQLENHVDLAQLEPWVAAADLDRDDDADLVLHDRGSQSIVVTRNPLRSQSSLAPKYEWRQLVDIQDNISSSTVTFELQHVTQVSLMVDTTHFEVEAWDLRGEMEVTRLLLPVGDVQNDSITASIDFDLTDAVSRYALVLARAISVDPGTNEIQSAGPDVRLFVLSSDNLGGVGEERGPAPAGTDPDPPRRNPDDGGPPVPSGG